MHIRFIIALLSVLLITACSTMRDFDTINGELAEIILIDGSKHDGELLFVRDSCMYFMANILVQRYNQPEFATIITQKLRINNIRSIEIKGLANKAWIKGNLLFQYIPALLMAIANESYNPGTFLATLGVGLIPSVLTTTIFHFSTPSNPMVEMNKINLNDSTLVQYFRYPAGLTDIQLKNFLKYYKLDSVIQADAYLK
jgi:hypothetical protein